MTFENHMLYGAVGLRHPWANSARPAQEDRYHALALIESGRVKTADLVSHTLPLDDLAHGIELVRDRMALKVVIEPSSG